MTTPVSTCIFKPRAPTPVITSGNVMACQQVPQCVKKNCGFPWWALFLILGLIIALIVWAIVRNSNAQPTTTPTTPIAQGAAAIGTGINNLIQGGVTGISNLLQGTGQTVKNIQANKQNALVMYTMKCKFCEYAKPEFKAASQKLNIPAYEIPREKLDPHQRPKAYPQICLYKSDGTMHVFDGQRTSNNIVNWVKNNLGNGVVKY